MRGGYRIGECMKNSDKKEKKGISELFGRHGTLIFICLFALIGILLIRIGSESALSKGKVTEGDLSSRIEQYSASLEAKISELCSKVKGVGNVDVRVYLDSGFETLYAYDEESKSSSSGVNSEKKYVTVGSGNEETMVTIVERMPNICGIGIVCTGGGDPTVARELIALISSAYGISSNKIYVTEGKK